MKETGSSYANPYPVYTIKCLPFLFSFLQVISEHLEKVAPLLTLSIPSLKERVHGLNLCTLSFQLSLQAANLCPQLLQWTQNLLILPTPMMNL